MTALRDDTVITISDLLGKVLFRAVAAAGTRYYAADLGRLPAGVYLLKTYSSQSSYQTTIVLK
jgi:hypothetical protein